MRPPGLLGIGHGDLAAVVTLDLEAQSRHDRDRQLLVGSGLRVSSRCRIVVSDRRQQQSRDLDIQGHNLIDGDNPGHRRLEPDVDALWRFFRLRPAERLGLLPTSFGCRAARPLPRRATNLADRIDDPVLRARERPAGGGAPSVAPAGS